MRTQMRKGAVVKYIGQDHERKELMDGKTYMVQHKCGSLIEIYAPTRYYNGEIHLSKCAMRADDFELIR